MTAKRVGRSVGSVIRDNPIPSLLIGAGVAMLFWRGEDDEGERAAYPYPYGYEEEEDYWADASGVAPEDLEYQGSETAYYSEYGQDESSEAGEPGAASRLKGKARETKEALRAKATSATAKMRERSRRARSALAQRRLDMQRRAGEWGEDIRVRAGRACEYTGRRMRETADEHPLAMGVGCLALGLLAGLALPRSAPEDRWIGDVSDEFRRHARETGQELVDRGKRASRAAADAIKAEASAQGLTPGELAEKAKHVGKEVRHAATEAVKREQMDPQSIKDKGKAVAEAGQEAAKSEATVQGSVQGTTGGV